MNPSAAQKAQKPKRLSFRLYPGIYKKLPPSDAAIVLILIGILCCQLFFLLFNINKTLLHETTIRYGEINEGIVGVPTQKNPLHATTRAEKDIAALLHAGLLKYDITTDTLIPHLAETHIQEIPNRHTFTLRQNITFHNGSIITATDVLYTIGMIQKEQKYKSPRHEAWKGVVAEAVDDITITITVPEGNLNFPEQFTAPILPQHIWKKIPNDKQRNYNGPGIHTGAGPYKYSRETITLDERPTTLTLEEFSGYVLGRPFIKTITLHFFVDVVNLLKAYELGTIDSIYGIAAAEAETVLKQREKESKLHVANTNRVFGVFFNAEDGRILQDSFLRSVLSQWVKRKQIITNVFSNHATPIQHPLATDTEIKELDITLEELGQTLEDIGWKFEAATGQRERNGVPLEISFVLPDIKETQQIADILADGWRRLGVGVTMKTLTEKEAAQAIKDKKFDAILYGYEANTLKDLVALWKSGNRENLASITSFGSPTLNNLLTELEQSTPPTRLADKISQPTNDNWKNIVYSDIKVEMMKNVPVIFLYSPHFLYILPKNINGINLHQKEKQELGRITNASDRFSNVHKWHIKREKVWKPFVEN